ncbi:hypothetical protein ACFP51_14890 [Streptomyces pratens]|uniref:Uncharacterized protein n=1 Tax=Streptomyces pratens TaxID=887456 RepID=A0ABW1M362_9ACTN
MKAPEDSLQSTRAGFLFGISGAFLPMTSCPGRGENPRTGLTPKPRHADDTLARLGVRAVGAFRVRRAPSTGTIRRVPAAARPAGLAGLAGLLGCDPPDGPNHRNRPG